MARQENARFDILQGGLAKILHPCEKSGVLEILCCTFSNYQNLLCLNAGLSYIFYFLIIFMSHLKAYYPRASASPSQRDISISLNPCRSKENATQDRLPPVGSDYQGFANNVW
jgi:hypothetical protein